MSLTFVEWRRGLDVDMLLHSQHLQIGSDGKRVACADDNAITVGQFDNSRQHRISEPGVAAIAVFAHQIWSMNAERTRLVRRDLQGMQVGVPHVLRAGCTALAVVPTGTAGVLLEGAERSVLFEHFGELQQTSIAAAGIVVPITGRRHVICNERLVRFGNGNNTRLATGVIPLGGSSLFDGKAVLLIVADASGGQGGILFATDTGRVQKQYEVVAGVTRLSTQRGLLFVNTSPRRLIAIDVRSGAREGVAECPVDIEDFAVDPFAHRIAIRSGGTVFVYQLALLSASSQPECVFDLNSTEVTDDAEAASHFARRVLGTVPVRLSFATPSPFATAACEQPPIDETQRMPVAVGDSSQQAFRPTLDLREVPASPTIHRDPHLAPRASSSGGEEPPPPIVSGSSWSDRDPDVLPFTGSRKPLDSGKVIPQAPVVDLFKLRGFGTAPVILDVTRRDAARMLDGELRWIELRALLATARGWDSGRIAYANESRHPQELEATASLAGNPGGRAREQVEATNAELADHESMHFADASRRSTSTPLGAIASEFQLSALATDILLVVAAPRLRGDLGRLYGILANDPKRALVDELLVEQILEGAHERSDIAFELGENGPLCRFGLVQVHGDRPRPYAALSVDPVIVARLRAEPINFGRGAATSVRTADKAVHELLIPSELLLEAMRYLSRAPSDDHQARIAVRGKVGSGRRTLLAALAHKAGRDLGLIDLKRLPRQPEEFAAALRIELQRAVLRGLVPCLVRLDDVAAGNNDPVRAVVQDILRSHQGPAAVHLDPRSRVPLDPGHLLLEIVTPHETERLETWSAALSDYDLPTACSEMLASKYRVGAGTIRRAVRGVAEARAEQGRLAGDVVSDIEEWLRQAREVEFGEHAERVKRLADWSSLVLPDDTLCSLRELVGRGRHRRTVFDQWGFDRVLSTSRGLTALFEGPPGTGKTLVAGVLARELGLDLYRVDLSKVMSKWIGETEKNLGAIFAAAEDGQVILLFDEADSLFAKRSEVKSSNDRFANLEVNFLLQRLDSFEGFAILTTNFGTSIDPAFKRRLSFRLTFPFPDHEMRVQLWRVHLPPELPVDGVLDLDSLARKYELSGGYIRNACVRAAFLAAEDGTALTHEHLERAVQLEYAEVGKLTRSGRME